MNVLHKIKINDLASKFHFSVNNFETATTLKILQDWEIHWASLHEKLQLLDSKLIRFEKNSSRARKPLGSFGETDPFSRVVPSTILR